MDPFDPIVKEYLLNGYGKPRLLDGLLYMEKISDSPFMYFRQCVIPTKVNKIVFSKQLLDKLYDLSIQPIEYVGGLSLIDDQMVMSYTKSGERDKCDINLKWKYMYHTHPRESNVPYSFYSTIDIGKYYEMRKSGLRKDYLTTETGLFSIELSLDALRIPVEYLMRVHDYMMSIYFQRDNIYVTLYEMIDFMNRLDGMTIANILCDSRLEDLTDFQTIGNIYYVNFIEWPLKDDFEDYWM